MPPITPLRRSKRPPAGRSAHLPSAECARTDTQLSSSVDGIPADYCWLNSHEPKAYAVRSKAPVNVGVFPYSVCASCFIRSGRTVPVQASNISFDEQQNIVTEVIKNTEDREITVQEGEALVSKALEESGATTLPGFNIVYWEKSSTPRFYFFTWVWANKGEGSAITGNYFVDRKTGDVWNAALCEELTSRALDKLKLKITKRIRLSELSYGKIRIDGPMC
jgi:hypothetical protein